MRVGAVCIGVEGYSHLTDVDCAVRDARALDVRLNSTPFCSSSFIRHTKATGTSHMLLRAIRTRLQELAEADAPPDLFLLYYGGHVVHLASRFDPPLLKETKTFLVPALAGPKCSDDCTKSCLSLTKVLNVLRKDLCAPARAKWGKTVSVLVVLDSLRHVIQSSSPPADDFSSCTTPDSTAIFLSHQRKVANHDCEMSPFVKACLDSENGMLADNIRVSEVLSNLLCNGEDAAVVGLGDIPEDFCCVQPEAPPEISEQLRTLLQNWKLEGQAHILVRHGVLDIEGLEAMQLEDVDAFGLNVRFRTLLEHVRQVTALRNADKKKSRSSNKAGSSKADEAAGIEDWGIGDDVDMEMEDAAAVVRTAAANPHAEAFLRTIGALEEEVDVAGIVKGMEMFLQDLEVQKACAETLLALASGDHDTLVLLLEHGVVQACAVCHLRIAHRLRALCYGTD